MNRKLSTACLILALGGLAYAGDTKLDPTGTWTWSHTSSANGRTSETVFILKLKGETLTGTRSTSAGAGLTITNGVFKGDQVSFQTRHEASHPKGMVITETFSGTLSGDTISGKEVFETNGCYFASVPWQITRKAGKP
jgi:hypothetical protein